MLTEIAGDFGHIRRDMEYVRKMNHGLFISYRVADDLYASSLIGNIAESSELIGSFSPAPPVAEGSEGEFSVTGINRMNVWKEWMSATSRGLTGWTGSCFKGVLTPV